MNDEDLFLPVGPPRGADTRPVVAGVLLAVDDATRTCQVSIAGGGGAWMPFLTDADLSAFIGAKVWVLRDAITGRATICLGLVESGYIAPVIDDVVLPATGTVTATSPLTVTAGGQTFQVDAVNSYSPRSVGDVVLLYWSSPSKAYAVGHLGTVTPPSAPATPTGLSLSRSSSTVTATWTKSSGSTSTDLRYSTNGGSTWKTKAGLTSASVALPIVQGQTLTVQVRANGPGGSSAYSSSQTLTWSKPTPPPPEQVTKTITITPTWSGSYRHAYSQWDRWNTDRYGGRSTLWQGNKYGSGDMTGLATYGNRIEDLDADEIISIEVTLRGAGMNSDHPSFVLQGSPHGSKPGGAPSSSGGTVSSGSGNPGKSNAVKVSLSSGMREAFRTGTFKGLCVVGSGYGGVRGTSAADGMALKVTYKVTI